MVTHEKNGEISAKNIHVMNMAKKWSLWMLWKHSRETWALSSSSVELRWRLFCTTSSKTFCANSIERVMTATAVHWRTQKTVEFVSLYSASHRLWYENKSYEIFFVPIGFNLIERSFSKNSIFHELPFFWPASAIKLLARVEHVVQVAEKEDGWISIDEK